MTYSSLKQVSLIPGLEVLGAVRRFFLRSRLGNHERSVDSCSGYEAPGLMDVVMRCMNGTSPQRASSVVGDAGRPQRCERPNLGFGAG